MEINRFELDNGLRVVHCRDKATAMVAVNTLYNVGARDEHPELTGMAHLFEHLMFGGSVNVEDFDGELSAAGGVSNAWTSNDFTNFYDILPAVNIETALWLESDRMLQLGFSEKSLAVQQSVVIEEFKQVCLNRPYGDMEHAFRNMAYKSHPYRFPVIGKEFSHIEKVVPDDVRRWFYSHYAPNNAVLAVCGNVEFGLLRELVENGMAASRGGILHPVCMPMSHCLIPHGLLKCRAMCLRPRSTSLTRWHNMGRWDILRRIF